MLKKMHQNTTVKNPGNHCRATRFALTCLPCIIVLLVTSIVQAELVVYPEPGDLSKCENLRRSTRYQVKVDGRSVFVYESRNTKQPDPRIMEAHICIFSFKNQSVTVEVTNLGGVVSNVKVSPLRLNLPVEKTGSTFKFTMDKPAKRYIRINDTPYPLCIFADAPDTAIPSGSTVRRFGPGYHEIGKDSYIMESNKEIYIDGGAVVEGTLKSTNALSNFKIRGRGIVYAGDYPWSDGAPWDMGIFYTPGMANSLVEGVLFLDSPYWNFGIKNESCQFNNMKIVGWHHNTDGIWVGPNSRVTDCFIINNDDSMRPLSTLGYTAQSSTVIDGVMIYNMAWGGAFKILANPLSWCPNPIQNMVFRNIDIIHSESWGSGDGCFLFIAQGSGDKVDIKNLTWENIFIESFTGKLFNVVAASSSSIKDLTFRNVTAPSLSGEFLGASTSESVDGVSFVNLKSGTTMIDSWSKSGLTKNSYVYNVTFKTEATAASPRTKSYSPMQTTRTVKSWSPAGSHGASAIAFIRRDADQEMTIDIRGREIARWNRLSVR